MEKGGLKGKNVHVCFGPPLMKNDPRHKKCDATADACTSPIDNTSKKETAHPCTTATFAPEHVFVSCLATRMVLSGQELFAIEQMATAGMGNKRIATTLGLPLSTTKRWLVSTARQCCRTRLSFNRLALQICLPQTLVERAQNTVRPASSSCPSRRLAGTFDPRVSQNVDRQALDVEKMGAPWVRRLKAFLNSDPGTSHCAAQRRCTKNTPPPLTRHLTLHGTLHRHRQHHSHRQHLPSRNGPRLTLRWVRGPTLASQKNLKRAPWLILF